MHAVPLLVHINQAHHLDPYILGQSVYTLSLLAPQLPILPGIVLPVTTYEYFQDFHNIRHISSPQLHKQIQSQAFPQAIIRDLFKQLTQLPSQIYQIKMYHLGPYSSQDFKITTKQAYTETGLIQQLRELYTTESTADTPSRVCVLIQPLTNAQISGVASNDLEHGQYIRISAVPGLIEDLLTTRLYPQQYVINTATQETISQTQHQFDSFKIRQPNGYQKHLHCNEEFIMPRSLLFELANLTMLASTIVESPQKITWVFNNEQLSIIDIQPYNAQDHFRDTLPIPIIHKKITI